jgi:hypothetical protein
MRIANSIRKPRPERTRVFYLVCGFLIISFASSLSFAKGPTTKITIESPRLVKQIEITDPRLTKEFPVFAGPQTLLVDWAAGPSNPGSGAETYRVSFYLAHYVKPYIVLYAYDHSKQQGYLYVPGKEDQSYRTNVSIVLRGVEGHWFRALPRWEDIVRPMIEKQLTIS